MNQSQTYFSSHSTRYFSTMCVIRLQIYVAGGVPFVVRCIFSMPPRWICQSRRRHIQPAGKIRQPFVLAFDPFRVMSPFQGSMFISPCPGALPLAICMAPPWGFNSLVSRNQKPETRSFARKAVFNLDGLKRSFAGNRVCPTRSRMT